MGTPALCRLLLRVLGFVLLANAAPLGAAEFTPTNAPAPTVVEMPAETQTLRAYLQLQEQLHGAVLAIEQARQEADAAARRNGDALAARLKLIEESLAVQREREIESIRGLNRLVLVAMGVFAGLGLLGLFWTGWLQLRAMNRLAEFAAGHLPAPVLGYAGPPGRLLAHEMPGVVQAPATMPDSRLAGVIERLEQRIRELETVAQLPVPGQALSPSNGGHMRTAVEAVTAAPQPVGAIATASAPSDGQAQVSLLLGKGQALLHLGHAERALACFDEVLALAPDHSEALVKKGTALERLDRAEEAIVCYDRAIHLNQDLTLAYLQKGGACNRLERFDEALQCYEQALKAQETGAR